MKRSLITAVTATAFAVVGTVALPSATANAETDPNCHVTFTMPAELALRYPIRAIPYSVDTSTCDFGANYSYGVSKGAHLGYRFGSVDTSEEKFDPYLDDDMRLGTWTWTGDATSEANDNVHGIVNTSTTDVRIGSSVGLTTRVIGSQVTASVSATRYWTSTHDTGVYAGAAGQIQYRASDSSPWMTLKSFTTDQAGTFTYTTSPAPINVEYRATLSDSTYIWGDDSNSVYESGSTGSAVTHPADRQDIGLSACYFQPTSRGVVSAPAARLSYTYFYIGASGAVDQSCPQERGGDSWYADGPTRTYAHSAFISYQVGSDLGSSVPGPPQRVPTLSDTAPLGTWTWNDDLNPDETSRYTDVRTGSVGYLTGTRSGHTVTLTAHAAAYWTSLHRFSYRSGAVGQLQYYDPTGKSWKALKNITGDAHGYSNWTGTVTPTRSFRVVYPDTTYTWGATSAVAKV